MAPAKTHCLHLALRTQWLLSVVQGGHRLSAEGGVL